MDWKTDPVFRAYVASALVLGLNLLLLANNTAVTRALATEVVNPEDKLPNAVPTVVLEGGNERTARYRRAHRNALENIPLFLITGWLAVVVGVQPTLAYALFGTFVAARVLHSIMYLSELQPWRTASFVLGALVQVALLGAIGWSTFG